MTLAEDIADACHTHDIYDIIGVKKRLVSCPLPSHIHKSNTPSFSIFTRGDRQWWRCHGSCDLDGDIVDLVGFLRINGYQKGNARYQREALALLDQRYEAKVVYLEKQVYLRGDEWIDFLPPGIDAIEYAHNRGLSLETIRRFNLGQSGHYLTMPCFEDQKLVGCKMRNIDPSDKKRRFWQLKGSRQGLFNFDKVYLSTGVVFVVKGEIPCMLLDQMGYFACAPTGGEGGWSERWRTALALAKKVVIGDNDPPGIKLAQNRATLLNAALVFPPEDSKDLDEAILKDPEGMTTMLNAWREQYGRSW